MRSIAISLKVDNKQKCFVFSRCMHNVCTIDIVTRELPCICLCVSNSWLCFFAIGGLIT